MAWRCDQPLVASRTFRGSHFDSFEIIWEAWTLGFKPRIRANCRMIESRSVIIGLPPDCHPLPMKAQERLAITRRSSLVMNGSANRYGQTW